MLEYDVRLFAVAHRRACAQLDYYLRRFGVFLEKAREEERLSASMDRRLGLAAGAILGLLVL